jgi:hypothetical protein
VPDPMAKHGSLRLVRVAVALFLPWLRSVEGFAAWLKCYVDLQDDSEVIMNNRIVRSENAEHIVTIQVRPEGDLSMNAWTDQLVYPAADGGGATTIHAKLAVPTELRRRDVQYVMEVVSGNAKFLSPVMCGGKRAHGGHYNDPVVLQIEGTSEHVELVAGFATGHEAVTLTNTLRLMRRSSNEDDEF